MKTPIKYCIFDVGQVCYPFSLEPLNNFCYEQSIDKKNFKSVKEFDYKPFMLGTINFHQFCQNLCAYCGLKHTSEIETQINQKMHQGVGKFYPETLKLFSLLRQKQIEICLLSNALPNLEDTANQLTDKIFTSYKIGLLKPDTKIYQYVLNNLKALPEEVIFIDDKIKNVVSAQKLGINGIVFNQKTLLKDIMNLF